LPKWDGGSRLNDWLPTYAGADTETHSIEYLRLIGPKYVMQAFNRASNPGAKADYSLVFNAGQGFYKDRVLGTMFAPYYREGIPSPSASQADFALGLTGTIVAHAAEMSAWRKADVEEQKAALTRCEDFGRRAYGYEYVLYKRRACFAFSLNDLEFLRDATGNRRYWVVSIIRDRVDIEGLRRDRDQILAEALVRLERGELHWPTPEEEERIIEPERQRYMPEAAVEVVNILRRFIVEKPQTTRPNRTDFAWKWLPRPQPLRELYLDEFFGQCFGMWVGLKRHGLDRASGRDRDCCTRWLSDNGWRQVEKRRSDGQKVRVWRASNWTQDRDFRSDAGSEPGSDLAKTSRDHDTANTADTAGTAAKDTAAAATAGQVRPQVWPDSPPKIVVNPLDFLGEKFSPTQKCVLPADSKSDSKTPYGGHFRFTLKIYGQKNFLGGTAPEGLVPAALGDLEERFPRDRFIALDVETTGLSAAADSVRTVQLCDGETAAILVFDQPVNARALVVLSDFLRGRRVVAHNARFEGDWLREAEIDLILDDTVLLFSAVRGTRSLHGSKLVGGGGGRVSLAMLAVMVLGETLDKSEQTSDWAAPELSPSQLTYAINDAIVTHRIWEALRAELHRKSGQRGVDIAAGYEASRPSWRTPWSEPASVSTLLPTRRGSPASKSR
jgi:hypothetical protein